LKEFFFFEYPCSIPDRSFNTFITGPASYKKLPEQLKFRALFIAPQEELKNYYPLQFGEYLGEPFDLETLDFRISKLCRINFFQYPIEQHRFYFTDREFLLLQTLMNNAGIIYSIKDLLKLLDCQSVETLRQIIYMTRKKLKQIYGKESNRIRSVKNLGYQWLL